LLDILDYSGMNDCGGDGIDPVIDKNASGPGGVTSMIIAGIINRENSQFVKSGFNRYTVDIKTA
jgi:hypothetical protein